MSDYKQVEEERDLVRDMHSKAIINTNKSAYLAAVQRKKVLQQQKPHMIRVDLQRWNVLNKSNTLPRDSTSPFPALPSLPSSSPPSSVFLFSYL